MEECVGNKQAGRETKGTLLSKIDSNEAFSGRKLEIKSCRGVRRRPPGGVKGEVESEVGLDTERLVVYALGLTSI